MDNNKTIQAAYYYYNMQLSYGPMFLGWPSSVYLKNDRYEKIINKLKNIDLGNLKVKCDVFENVIKNHGEDFLFLDPPYYLGNKSRLYGNNGDMHESFQHKKLYDNIIKYNKWIITYNNCEYIRELYKDYTIIDVNWNYGMNKSKKSSEIVIINH